MDASGLERVEAQRLLLEESLAKLRKSLRHWQTLEIDYESLREEFQSLSGNLKKDNYLSAARESGAELVDEKELLSLIENGGLLRKPSQIVELLSKRIEYVSRNIDTIRKQVSDAEKRRNAILLAEDSDHREEAGLPLTEITEELDDNDQVVSTKLQTAADSTPQLVDVLKKAGVSDIVDKAGTVTAASTHKLTGDDSEAKTAAAEAVAERESQVDQVTTGASPRGGYTGDLTSKSPNEVAKISSDAQKSGFSLGEKPGKRFNGGSVIEKHPDDTEEDTALRQEMLQYGLGEVGAIVAELDLEEQTSNDDDETDSLLLGSDFDEDEDDDEEESDDEKGMTKHPVISEQYRRRMEELGKKLGVQGIQNVGRNPELPQDVQDQLGRPSAAEAARKAAIARADAVASEQYTNDAAQMASNKTTSKKKKNKNKKVAFSDDLDIATPSKPVVRQGSVSEHNAKRATVRPISDTIVDSLTPAAPAGSASSPAPTSKRVSRFKAENSESPRVRKPEISSRDDEDLSTAPHPKIPPGKLIADTLVERPVSRKHSRALPPDPNDIDEELHKRQIATEYYQMRNRIIHEQGGFVGEGEEDNYGDETAPLYIEDEATGQVKKVSRFKAARMK